MAKPKLVLYVDVVSPFAYLAFHILNVSGFLIYIKSSGNHIVPFFFGLSDNPSEFSYYYTYLLFIHLRISVSIRGVNKVITWKCWPGPNLEEY